MISMLLLKYWRHLVLIVTISTILYNGYSHVKNIGYLEAENKYISIIQKYNDDVAAKVVVIEKSSNDLLSIYKTSNDKLSKDIATIVVNSKAKPLTIIKEGTCLPSTDMSDTINSINARVNEGLK